MISRRSLLSAVWLSLALYLTVSVLAQESTNGANGKLQIHYINVGQGDAQLIVSPLGETMLIDSGPASSQACASATGLITYLANAGVTRLDYHVASHYDADHIGCSDVVIGRWPVQVAALDRGATSVPGTQTYARYATAASAKRQTASVGQVVTLDAASGSPVRFSVIAVNGNGTAGTLSENDRSVVMRLSFGSFDALFGGDIAGQNASGNHDLESLIAASVGEVEVYKVHHHGSATSSNANFLATIHPKVAMLSVGSPNAFDHPTVAALDRVRAVVSNAYWTTAGDGAPMQAKDSLSGSSIIEVPSGGQTFQVNYGSHHDLFTSWSINTPPPTFTDDPLTTGVTSIKAAHLTELRTAVDTLRARYQLVAFTWTDATIVPGETVIKSVHITELRSALSAVYVAAGRTPPTYSAPTLTVAVSGVLALNITELRAAIVDIWNP